MKGHESKVKVMKKLKILQTGILSNSSGPNITWLKLWARMGGLAGGCVWAMGAGGGGGFAVGCGAFGAGLDPDGGGGGGGALGFAPAAFWWWDGGAGAPGFGPPAMGGLALGVSEGVEF